MFNKKQKHIKHIVQEMQDDRDKLQDRRALMNFFIAVCIIVGTRANHTLPWLDYFAGVSNPAG